MGTASRRPSSAKGLRWAVLLLASVGGLSYAPRTFAMPAPHAMAAVMAVAGPTAGNSPNGTDGRDPQTTAAPKSGTPTTPDERSTEFRAVTGGEETRSGELLLVEAYCVLWVILMTWVLLLWRKQAGLHARLDELESILDKAAKSAKAGT